MTTNEAIDIIQTIKDVGYFTDEGNEAFDKALVALKKESEGKWLVRDSMKGGYAYLTCECGKRHTIGKPESTPVYTCSICGFGDYVSIQPYKYCPNCGAKMDERGRRYNGN